MTKINSKKLGLFIVAALVVLTFLSIGSKVFAAPTAAAAATSSDSCGKDRTFFLIPTWYKYLDLDPKDCSVIIDEKIAVSKDGKTVMQDVTLVNVWLILLAVVDILLRVAGFVAFIFIIIGAFKFVVSEGNPDKIANARMTVFNSLIGAVIAIVSSQVVAFVAGQLSKTSNNSFGLSETPADTTIYELIVNSTLAILGAISVLMVVIQGIRFMLARDNPEKVAKARSGIIYALVGLAIAIFAGAIINFVIKAVIK